MITYKIRISGSNDFVCDIYADDETCDPPGSVSIVEGWDNPAALIFLSKEGAEAAAEEVQDIEGFHCVVEEVTLI